VLARASAINISRFDTRFERASLAHTCRARLLFGKLNVKALYFD